MSKHWSEIAAEKRARLQEAIPKEWLASNLPDSNTLNVVGFPETSGMLSPKEIEITVSDVEVLLRRLAEGVWTAVEVTTAFAKRAVIAHSLINCLTEAFFDRALARAKELDEHLKLTGKVVGPLHGLPISLKDQVNIKGLESTLGKINCILRYVSWIGKYADRNAVLADILESLGAVLYVKTNVPQTLMWGETFNHIFGRTTNPHNRKLTAGGSSGGEGAIIALRGSPLGVGTDLGGSVRIPAGFCGTYGFRPSHGRVPYAGSVNTLEGQDSIPSVLGPLSNSIFGLKIFMQAVMSKQPWLKDPLVIRKKWDEDEYQLVEHGGGKQLCFAVIWDDGEVVPHPPITRGLEIVKKALMAEGHKVIDWKALHSKEFVDVAESIYFSGSIEDFETETGPTKEPKIVSMALDQERAIPKDSLAPGISPYELWQIQKRKRDLRQAYLDHWQGTESVTGTGRPVDAIISPMAPYAAPPHGENSYLGYTIVWNVLDHPAVIIPVSKVTATDVKRAPHDFLNELDKGIYEAYDPEVYRDAPVAVQVVGGRFEDEAVIRMSEIVDAAVKKAQAKDEA